MDCSELVLNKDCLHGISAVVPARISLDKSRIVIGKGAPQIAVDVVMEGNNFISRRHAEMRLASDGSCIIHDLGSCNGLFVNDVRIMAQKLEEGDVVQFGGSKNTPIGSRIEHCDACLKYTFRAKAAMSDSASKRKQKDSSGSESGSHSKRSKVVSPDLKTVPATAAAGASAAAQRSPRANTAVGSTVQNAQQPVQRQYELEQQLGVLSARLAEATRDLVTAKTQSDLQIEAINARNAAIVSITKQKNALEQNCSELTRAMEELRAHLADGLNEAAQLRAAAVQADRELHRLNEQIAAQAAQAGQVAAASVVIPSTSSISGDTLLESLQCPLCQELLIDAVVLPCSHGFCRACVESHWDSVRRGSSGVRGGGGSSSAALKGKAACRCPRCDAATSAMRGNPISSSNNRSSAVSWGYVRCDHLDNLVWLVLETCTPAARKEHERREHQQRRMLQGLGIDPDLPLISGEVEEAAVPSAAFVASSSSAGSKSAVNPQHRGGAMAAVAMPNPAQTSKCSTVEEKLDASTHHSGNEAFCDFCGEDGHEEESCPHRLHDRPDSGESTDCSDSTEDDGEEDM